MDLVGYVSGSQIDKAFLDVSRSIKVPKRGEIVLTEEDHCVITGATENKVHFKIQASKAAEDSELGFHIHITLQNGEISYSSQHPHSISFKLCNKDEMKEIDLDASRSIDDPKTETAYWSDSFYLQDKLWLQRIMRGKLKEPLANIEVGVEIQNLISLHT